MKYLFMDRFSLTVLSLLKWGMLLVGVGAAVIIAQLLRAVNVVHASNADAILFALVFIFGGGVLVVYYFIVKRMIKNKIHESIALQIPFQWPGVHPVILFLLSFP